MSKQIDKIKKIKVKNSLLKGNSAKQALLDANYSPATAEHSTGMAVVKCSQEEIIQEMKGKVTVDYVINNLFEDRKLAKAKGDIATATRVDELLGKYLAMFTDKTENTNTDKPDNQFSLERLSRIKQNEN